MISRAEIVSRLGVLRFQRWFYCLGLVLFVSCTSAERGVTPGPLVDFSQMPTWNISPEPIAGGFALATDLDVTNAGFVYVTDARRHHLIRLNTTGARIDSVGGRGVGAYQFSNPQRVDASNDLKIYVSDVDNRRIQMFDRRFQLLGTVRLLEQSGREIEYVPGDLSTSRLGELFFWDDAAASLRKLSVNTQLDSGFQPDVRSLQSAPATIELRQNYILLLDAGTGIIYRYTELGQYVGFLSGFGSILDLTTTDSYLIILTKFHLIKATHAGIPISVAPHNQLFSRISASESHLFLLNNNKLFRAELE
jgi:hypothetical protein